MTNYSCRRRKGIVVAESNDKLMKVVMQPERWQQIDQLFHLALAQEANGNAGRNRHLVRSSDQLSRLSASHALLLGGAWGQHVSLLSWTRGRLYSHEALPKVDRAGNGLVFRHLLWPEPAMDPLFVAQYGINHLLVNWNHKCGEPS